jgi:glycerol-3-phosphate acyltransferase PlsY
MILSVPSRHVYGCLSPAPSTSKCYTVLPSSGAGSLDALALGCVAYLLGSFPSGLVLVRLATGRDVRKQGSGNIGAANVTRTAGIKIGAVAAVLDIAKGTLPVLLGRWLGLGSGALATVAMAAVVGHDYSLFLRFRGGKGVATTFGVSLALAPLAAILSIGAWLLILVTSRYSSLASLIALALLPVWMALMEQPPAYLTLETVLFMLAAVKHRENIVRLAQGKELKTLRRRPSDA